MTQPHVRSGRPVKLEQVEDSSYPTLTKRLTEFPPDVLILESRTNIPDDPAVRRQLVESELVCGQHPAFIPASVSGEQREAAQIYLHFLVSGCGEMTATQPTPPANSQPQTEGQPEADPNRPACSTPMCEKTKAFLKSHYCGDSPFGNGPDDGCDIRVERKRVPSTTLTADYFCQWNDAEGKSECHKIGQASTKARDILLREMHRVGLPTGGEQEVHFTVLESTSGWSLMAANYDHVSGSDLAICQVVVVVDQSGQAHVLRELPLKKTDADVPEVTTWSPVDLADVDGDGQLEVVLEGDAYENHWFEVVQLQDGSFKTVFSGLGYYL